jgi:hypothetical protein
MSSNAPLGDDIPDLPDDWEDEEPVEKIVLAFERGEKGVTAHPTRSNAPLGDDKFVRVSPAIMRTLGEILDDDKRRKKMKYARYAALALLGAVVGWAGYQSARNILQRRREKAIPDVKDEGWS